MKITDVTLKLLVLNNKEEGYLCPIKRCTFANLDFHVFYLSKYIYIYIYIYIYGRF